MKKSFSDIEHLNASIAVVFLLLIIYLVTHQIYLVYTSLALLFFAALSPKMSFPLSFIWYNLAFYLSKISSTILLVLVYILLIFPVGLIRRAFGKDTLKLKLFKKSHDSVFIDRNHEFKRSDLINPY